MTRLRSATAWQTKSECRRESPRITRHGGQAANRREKKSEAEITEPFRAFGVFRGQIAFIRVDAVLDVAALRQPVVLTPVGGSNEKPKHSTAHQPSPRFGVAGRAVATGPISYTREPLAARAGASLPLLPRSTAHLRA